MEWIDSLARDVKQAVRHLSHDWHFSSAAILILALGIGANTGIFSATWVFGLSDEDLPGAAAEQSQTLTLHVTGIVNAPAATASDGIPEPSSGALGLLAAGFKHRLRRRARSFGA